MNSGGEAKNIKPMQAWTDLTLPGEGGDTVPFPGPGRGEQAVVSSTFYRSPTESQGAGFFSLQLLLRVSQPLPWMRVHFRYPLLRGDGIWSLLTRLGVPTPPLRTHLHCSVWGVPYQPMTFVLQLASSLERPRLQRLHRTSFAAPLSRSTLLSDAGLS